MLPTYTFIDGSYLSDSMHPEPSMVSSTGPIAMLSSSGATGVVKVRIFDVNAVRSHSFPTYIRNIIHVSMKVRD